MTVRHMTSTRDVFKKKTWISQVCLTFSRWSYRHIRCADFTVRAANPFLDLQLAWSSFTTDQWTCLTQFTPSHPFFAINISSSQNRIRLPAYLHVWNQNSKLHCLQQSITDIYRKSGSIKSVQCTEWYSRFSPTKKVHPTVMTTRFGPVRNVQSTREYDHTCSGFFYSLCTFGPNLSNRTRI